MDTTASAIARIEAGGGKEQHSPSLITLKKYAAAVGCELDVKLKPIKMQRTHGVSRRKHKTLKKAAGR